jgi:hypothetical protein
MRLKAQQTQLFYGCMGERRGIYSKEQNCLGKHLQLHALAYNLATFLRCIELPEAMADWSLTSLQLKLIKMGARVVRHARAITFQLAEVAVTGPMVRAHPDCDPPPSSAAVMCLTAILTASERKRQDRSVHHAEERRRRAKMMRVCRPTCPNSILLIHANAAQGPKTLDQHAKSSDHDLKQQATWGMSDRMIIRNFLASATIASTMLIPSTSMADASDLDGYWGGQVKFRGGFGVEVFLTSSQGFSELKIRNSSGFGFLNQVRANQAVFPDEYLLTDADMTLCEYFIKNSSAGEVKELVLNTDLSRNVNCPREPEISLDREADKIAVSITSDKLTAKLQIFSNYRPLKKEELGTLPSGFDVLGVTVGTAEHEARKILEDRGFRELDVAEQYVLETNTWSQQALNFVKGDIGGDQNLPSFSDHVLLVLNTEVIGTSEPRHVVYLARKRDYGAHGEAGTDFSGLLEALTKKHGITVGGFETRPTRNYTFEGENISGLK